MFDNKITFFIKYELWPLIKTRIYFWWWVMKYRGKKNIPPEVIFGQMAKSMQRMNDNLRCARASMMDDASKEEMKEIYEVIDKVERFEADVDKIQRDIKYKEVQGTDRN